MKNSHDEICLKKHSLATMKTQRKATKMPVGHFHRHFRFITPILVPVANKTEERSKEAKPTKNEWTCNISSKS